MRFAGWRSDSFFFDAGPERASGGVALWHRTLVGGGNGDGDWVQADRGGRPSQSVFFSPGEEEAAYLGGEPATDGRFVDSFAHVLEHAGGYSPSEAKRVAETLLPDVLPYDPAQPAAYPRNGRTLTDDVGDHFPTLFTNGR